MESNFSTVTAYIRLIPLFWVIWSSVKHCDFMGLSIGILWALAIVLGTLLHLQYATPVILTPLVFIVSWYILKNHRGVK